MNNSLIELKNIFKQYPDTIIEKIYYYQIPILDYKIKRNIINFNWYNTKYEYSIYSYVNYIPIKYSY